MATAAMVGVQSGMQLGSFIKDLLQKIKDFLLKMKEFAHQRFVQLRNYAQARKQHLDNYFQKVRQHGITMAQVAKFFPIIQLVLIVLLVLTNLFKYVLMGVAYVVLAVVLVWYELSSLPPFIWIWFILYYIFIELTISAIIISSQLALLLGITLLCLLLAGLDKMLGGRLRFLLTCQNSPAAWYLTPSHQFGNKFARGIFCSRPCLKGFAPNETGGTCVRLPKEAPAFCPQAQIMRIYSKQGGNDRRFDYRDMQEKRSIKYLLKTPQAREEMLLKSYVERVKFLDKCMNPENPHGLGKYNHVTMNLCASIAALKQNGVQNLQGKDFKRLERVCNQAFCSVRSSYPFCTTLSNVSSMDNSDLLKKIIYAMIALTVFGLTFQFILMTMHEQGAATAAA